LKTLRSLIYDVDGLFTALFADKEMGCHWIILVLNRSDNGTSLPGGPWMVFRTDEKLKRHRYPIATVSVKEKSTGLTMQ
jgi:hypothetical protein